MSEPILRAEHLGITFGGLKAVSDFNMTINAGELVGLIGPNGAGKTTVFNLLTGVYQPTEGEFFLDGRRMNGKKTYQVVRAGIARTFQNIRLFDKMTVEENVLVAFDQSFTYRLGGAIFRTPKFWKQERDMHAKAIDLLRIFGLEGLANTEAANLPYGAQRKLEIARALATGMKLLLLDEPTNDLDIVTLGVLEEYLQAFKGCVIVVSHDRYFVDKVADHLLVFCGGGEIREFAGTYSDYTAWKRDYEAAKQAAVAQEKAKSTASGSRGGEIRKSGTAPAKTGAARKLTFQEKREMEHLEAEIPELEQEKAAIEEKLSSGDLPFEELTALSERITALMDQIDTKSMRWLELSEIGG